MGRSSQPAIARRLQKPEITQAPADERPRLLIDALTSTRSLLVLDNLETLTDADHCGLVSFLGHIPCTCKALLTNCSIVVPREGEEKHALVPMVAVLIGHMLFQLEKSHDRHFTRSMNSTASTRAY